MLQLYVPDIFSKDINPHQFIKLPTFLPRTDYFGENNLITYLCLPICTLEFLADISFVLLLYHPGGCLGCPEKQTNSRKYNLFVWSAVFLAKMNDIKITFKNCQNLVKNYCSFGILSEFVEFWLENSSPN